MDRPNAPRQAGLNGGAREQLERREPRKPREPREPREPRRWGALATAAVALCAALALTGCPAARLEERTSEARSNELLREGLEAQRRGDEATAQAKMEEALRVDALNARARTALASVHAGRAGVVMATLIEPIYKASDELESEAKALSEERRKAKVEELKVRLLKEGEEARAKVAASGSSSASAGASSGTAPKPSLTTGDAKSESKAQARLDEAGRFGERLAGFVAQVNFFLFLMNAMPLLTKEGHGHLLKAIRVLREDSLAPQRRGEEARLYLAILGAVRFTSSLRTVVGAAPVRAGDLERLRVSFCSLETDEARKRLVDVRESLSLMEEGLTPSSDDPDTAKRRSRRRLQLALTAFLDSEIFRRTEAFFDPDKPDGALAHDVVRLWCDQGIRKDIPKLAP